MHFETEIVSYLYIKRKWISKLLCKAEKYLILQTFII